MTLTVKNLAIGQLYEIQVWASAGQFNSPWFSKTSVFAATNSVALRINTSVSELSPRGQFATGDVHCQRNQRNCNNHRCKRYRAFDLAPCHCCSSARLRKNTNNGGSVFARAEGIQATCCVSLLEPPGCGGRSPCDSTIRFGGCLFRNLPQPLRRIGEPYDVSEVARADP